MPGIAPTPSSPHITLIITIQVLLQSTSSRSYALSVLNVLVAASKLKSSRTFHLNVTLQFETKEAADWFKQPDILLSILPRIDSSAKLKNRAYQILLPRVPVCHGSICDAFPQGRPGFARPSKARTKNIGRAKCWESQRKHVDRLDGSGWEYWRIGRLIRSHAA